MTVRGGGSGGFADLVAAGLFADVEGFVGPCDERRTGAVRRSPRSHSHADRHRARAPRIALDGGAEPLGNMDGAVAIGVGQQDREFLPPNRATKSDVWDSANSVAATRRKTSSPTGWPNSSLIDLK
jgi:hypothetical protein